MDHSALILGTLIPTAAAEPQGNLTAELYMAGGGENQFPSHDLSYQDKQQCFNYANGSFKDDERLEQIQFVMFGIILHIICIFGVVGNLVSFFVLSRKEMRSSSSCYLMALMIFNTVVLLTAYSNDVMTGIGVGSMYGAVSNYILTFGSAVGQWCSDCSTWLTIALTVERYIFVCHTFQASTMCTMRRAIIVIVFLSIGMFLYDIPWFLRQEVRSVTCPFNDEPITYIVMRSEKHRPSDMYYNIQLLYIMPALFLIVPIFVLTAFTVILLLEVRKSNKLRQQMSTTQTAEINVTVVLISVVVVFLICTLPNCIFAITRTVKKIEKADDPYFDIYFTFTGRVCFIVANVFFYSNSALNFLIFCTVGQKFRKTFKRIFLRRCKFLTTEVVRYSSVSVGSRTGSTRASFYQTETNI
ncbi:FMRFamide receptor [Lingula anatina]|uniref:FMRFamide receptor n=1 Tax=Lingula anatina TaxID=7574 RepID=A0A1S3HPN0_LINAN|nr:FMRFamide receptor [Lingula anatina]|eukprot:XP_013387990.1 FMRFamide receptor [Lingula anatina]